MDEFTETQRGSGLSWLPQLVTGRAMDWMLAERGRSPCSEPLNPLPFFTDLFRDCPLPLESKSQEVKGFPFPRKDRASRFLLVSPSLLLILLFFFLYGSIISQIAYWFFFSFLIEKNNSLRVTFWFAQWFNSRESASKKQIPCKGSQLCLVFIYSGAVDRLRETESLLDTQWVQ